jgi:hypothetical protein
MKLRSTSLAFASLLLVGSLAGAYQTSTPAAPESAILAAIFSAPAPPESVDAELPSFQPTPIDQAFSCGPCSDTSCQGKQYGQYCTYLDENWTQHPGTCRYVLVDCSPRDCQCVGNYIP